jgi:hypothetical protein
LAHAAICASRRSKTIEFSRKVPFEPTPVSRRGISLSLGLVDHIDLPGKKERLKTALRRVRR